MQKNNIEKTCCFVGHRNVNITEELIDNLFKTIHSLIVEKGIKIFLFGSRSQFNDLCYKLVTELREEYSHINRVFVRAEYPIISEEYKKYLLQFYEDTYFPDKIKNAGKCVYVERNMYMIDNSNFCIIYYRGNNNGANRLSGTKLALRYAIKKGKSIMMV